MGGLPEAGDYFEKGAFAAAGRADDGGESLRAETRGDFAEEHLILGESPSWRETSWSSSMIDERCGLTRLCQL